MPVTTVLEYIGIFAFALAGAFTAIQKRMDWFGIYVLSAITAMGGGVIRDVVMDRGVPVFFSSYYAIWLIIAGATTAILLRGRFRWNNIILLCDAIGLAVFAADAGAKAISWGCNLPEFVFVSVITGVGGGVLRDILCQRVPVIMRKEVYASAALLGALVMWPLRGALPVAVWSYCFMGLVFAVRMVSLYFNMNVPRVPMAPAAPRHKGEKSGPEC